MENCSKNQVTSPDLDAAIFSVPDRPFFLLFNPFDTEVADKILDKVPTSDLRTRARLKLLSTIGSSQFR